jgi:hypothetical protein
MRIPRPRRPRTAEWIRGIFVAQVAMAAWLVAHDLGPALARFNQPKAPEVSVPVTPGDQTRRYQPRELPGFTPPPGRRDLPAFDTMPARLQFRADGDGGAALTGEIAEGDAARFDEWLAAQAEAPARVWLHSPGGSVADALAIGAALRAAGIATAVADGSACFSACPYVFAGGVLRRADAGAMVGVHQHYFGENTALPAFIAVRDIQAGQARVVAYLAEMGIDLRVLEPALATPPEDIYILTPAELERYRLTRADAAP